MAQNKHHIPKWKIPGISWISHTKSDSSRSQSSSSAALSTVFPGLAPFHYFSFPWCMCDGPGIIITALLFSSKLHTIGLSDIMDPRLLDPINPFSSMLAKPQGSCCQPQAAPDAAWRSWPTGVWASVCRPWWNTFLGSCFGGAWNPFRLGFLLKWIRVIIR